VAFAGDPVRPTAHRLPRLWHTVTYLGTTLSGIRYSSLQSHTYMPRCVAERPGPPVAPPAGIRFPNSVRVYKEASPPPLCLISVRRDTARAPAVPAMMDPKFRRQNGLCQPPASPSSPLQPQAQHDTLNKWMTPFDYTMLSVPRTKSTREG
jgi:hypothetical protein